MGVGAVLFGRFVVAGVFQPAEALFLTTDLVCDGLEGGA
jgi:hypothetical protein